MISEVLKICRSVGTNYLIRMPSGFNCRIPQRHQNQFLWQLLHLCQTIHFCQTFLVKWPRQKKTNLGENEKIALPLTGSGVRNNSHCSSTCSFFQILMQFKVTELCVWPSVSSSTKWKDKSHWISEIFFRLKKLLCSTRKLSERELKSRKGKT